MLIELGPVSVDMEAALAETGPSLGRTIPRVKRDSSSAHWLATPWAPPPKQDLYARRIEQLSLCGRLNNTS